MICLAKVMPKIRFWPALGGFWAVLGPETLWYYVVGLKTLKNPRNLKIQKKISNESFDPKFFSGFSSTLKGLV